MNLHASPTGESSIRQIDIVKIYTNKKCLIVDDFPEIRGSLSRALKIFGCLSVDTAANGDDAIRLCTRKNYDIVICDYNLGAGKDGQQILEEVRHQRVLPMTSLFVMITGESSREMVLGALECQPDDYITKPYTQASLKLRLDKAVVRHEALLPIKRCISNGDYQSALELCNAMIVEGGRYASDCLKLKGQLHFLLKQIPEAKTVYEDVLSRKSVIWARLGMGKTLKELGNYASAKTTCQQIIDEDERYIEAHDLLSEIHLENRETTAAQRSVERATRISPKSVLRHRRLADIAEQNHDDETALRSHQQAIKWGANSCLESEQDYFNYARKVAEMVRGHDSDEAKILVRQAGNFLERARKRYVNRPEVTTQALLVEAQIEMAQGHENKARDSLQRARVLYKEMLSPPVETSLELARALHAVHEEDEARTHLTRIAAKNADNKALLQRIDCITEEPISEFGKETAALLTKTGIDAYDKKAYKQAIQIFNEALVNYPKHIGLHLNLVQAICADTEANAYSESNADMCQRSMKTVGHLAPNHKQYPRQQFLLKQLKKLFPDLQY